MNIPEPVTTGLVVAGTLQIGKQAQDFFAAALGHPGETIGTTLGNLTERRLKNLHAIGIGAHLILLNLGVPPKEVPLKTIHQLLEGSSVEEDPELQKLWANLWANATDSRTADDLSPSFANALRNLTLREAKLLKALFEETRKLISNGETTFTYDRLRNLYREAVDGDTTSVHWNGDAKFHLTVDILQRERLLQTISFVPEQSDLESLKNLTADGTITVTVSDRKDVKNDFRLSAFGRELMEACEPPRHSS